MTTLTIDMPDSVFPALHRAPDELVRDMRIEAAVQWYAQQRVSQEKAAEIAGISRAELIDELARRCIPVIQVSFEDLMEEVRRDG
jgi:predicted HTH domain antitoxin